MRTKFVFYLIVLITLSCDSNVASNTFIQDFDSNRWPKNTSREVKFEILIDRNYDVIIHFAHVFDFQFEKVPMEIQITKPTRDVEKRDLVLNVKDNNGKDIASCGGDICDLYQDFDKNVMLTKGIYKMKITNKFPSAYLPNVLGIGVKVETSVQ